VLEQHLQKLSKIFPQGKIFVVTPNKSIKFPKQKEPSITLIHDLDSFIKLGKIAINAKNMVDNLAR